MKAINSVNRITNNPIVVINLEKSTFAASNKVYGIGGVCPTLLARDYKDLYKICLEVES